ncbi:MAG TPA: rod shape-determining protein MreC [Candidatus Limnocylindrales bacterium]
MLQTRAARRQAVAYALLVALSLLLLAFSASPPLQELRRGVAFAMAPLQGSLRDATRQVGSWFAALGEIERLRLENEDLARRVQELEAQLRQTETIRLQNEQFAALLEVRSALEYDTVAAEVVSRRTTGEERVITIGKGSEAGIRVDDVVIAGGAALVGKVVEVGPGYSHVWLLNDTRFRVVGLDEATRASGTVTGQLERPLAMINIPATEPLAVGETIVTAGIDLGQGIRSPFPRGLLIGRVVDVQSAPADVLQSALIEPAAQLDRLEYVLVIVNYNDPSGSPNPSPTLIPAP